MASLLRSSVKLRPLLANPFASSRAKRNISHGGKCSAARLNKFPTRDFRAASVLFDVARRRYSTEAVQKVEVKTEITPEPAKTETEATKTTDKWANVQRLIELCRPEAKPLAVAMVALGFSSAATLILPAAMGRIIDMLTTAATTTSEVQVVMGGLVGLFTLASVASYFRYSLLQIASQRIVNRLRKNLFNSLIAQETAFFDDRKTGELVNRLASDTEIMSKSLLENFASGVRRVIEGVGGLAVLFWMAPKLTLTMLAVIPPVFLAAMYYGKVTDVLAAATSLAEEKFAAIRTVRNFAQEMRESNAYAKRVDDVFSTARSVARINATFFSGIFFAVNMSMVLVLYHGATIVLDGAMTAGHLTSFLLYAIYVGFAFSGVGNFYGELMRSLGSSERVFSLMDRIPVVETGGLRPEKLDGSITFDNVVFAYPTRSEQTILNGFSLDMQPGSVIAIVGHSGSGKSTVFSLLSRLYEPNSGSILVDGKPVTAYDAHWLREHIGIVPQDVSLFATTVRENIAYGRPDASDEEVIEAAKQANAHDFIMKFPQGYDTQVGQAGLTVSGGQRQRIAIARALLKSPKILLLDEATSSLDVESEYLIQQALERLMKNRTVLIVAHRLSTIKNAHRIAVLSEGKVIEQGSFSELLAQNGAFKQLVDRQEY